MMIRRAATVVAAVLLVGGCSGSGNDSGADRTNTPTSTTTTMSSSPVATTATPPTTSASGNADQQVCTAARAIEARGFRSNPQELLQIAATGSEATTDEIVTDSAFLAAAATAGDLQRAGEIIVGLLEVCRQHGYI